MFHPIELGLAGVRRHRSDGFGVRREGKTMLRKRPTRLAMAAMAVVVAQSGRAADNNATAIATQTLGTTVNLPPLYEPTIQSIGALAASGATSLKTFRSDARTQSIRAALSKVLLGAPPSTITLDKANTDPALGEVAILCAPRAAYAGKQLYQNYLSTLVQNIDAVSSKTTQDSTILDALKLLFASSSYNITDAIGVDPKAIVDAATKSKAACEADLESYAPDYYGVDMPERAPTAASTAAAGGVVDLSFLGPVGTLITTFLGVIQPVLTQAASAVDQHRRDKAIQTALVDNEPKIADAGEQLADAIDSYVAAARHRLAGAFVEQLVSIRTMPIDLSKVEECRTIKGDGHSPSGAPDPAFIACWGAAWGKIQPQIDKLNTIGDNYDTFVDAGTKTAKSQFVTIIANYKKIQAGDSAISVTHVFDEITQFINFANAVSGAASKSNIDKLKSAAAAVEKAVGQ
jgi:hypothetical protein